MMGGLDGARRLFESDVSKPKSVSETLRRFWGYFSKYWYGLGLALLLIVASTWTQVVSPDYIGQAVDCYLFPNPMTPDACWYTDIGADAPLEEKLSGLTGLVAILVGLYVAGSIITGLSFFVMSRTGQRVLLNIRTDLFKKLQNQTLGYYAENESGNLMSRLTSDTDTIQQVFSFALVSVVSGFLLMLWIGVKMLQANWIYALLSLAVVPIMYVATVYFSGQARKAFRKSRQEMGSVNANLQESIAGMREVQAFNREEESIENFRATNAANRDANVRASAFTSALNPTLEALGYVAIAVVVVVGGLSVINNQPLLGIGTAVISLGTVFAFLQYVQRFNQPIQQIAVLWTNLQSAIAGGERIFSLLDADIDIVDKPNARQMPQIQGKVVFNNVTSAYKPGELVLKGVSFEADPGQMIAIVGPTGAGKTTIINMIPRFYDVIEGTVTIDGVDVRDVTMESLRAQIGIVLQDTYLFSDTVMNNIRYGRLDATDEEVIAAARMVSADTFIERLPEKYETVLGERGSGLSQGQRQLIAIARVALMNPRILILDEATSSVDTRTERLIQKAFERIMEGRTTFVIAHRLSTIRNANNVLLLRDGVIVESGTHHELLEQKGAYYELYMSQFRHEETAEAV
ncbi:MAG: ABC transporter ATP-binding protein/permease [Pleurocapsa minor GSE-CHR-MK-17-07R]|jgi:ATP-binding cassette subfamily B protein|nr:ABC transporter ATP-binding protein/permease [Pleurocapsa minor GSE-CHR-MK 17-07R]